MPEPYAHLIIQSSAILVPDADTAEPLKARFDIAATYKGLNRKVADPGKHRDYTYTTHKALRRADPHEKRMGRHDETWNIVVAAPRHPWQKVELITGDALETNAEANKILEEMVGNVIAKCKTLYGETVPVTWKTTPTGCKRAEYVVLEDWEGKMQRVWYWWYVWDVEIMDEWYWAYWGHR